MKGLLTLQCDFSLVDIRQIFMAKCSTSLPMQHHSFMETNLVRISHYTLPDQKPLHLEVSLLSNYWEPQALQKETGVMLVVRKE